MGTAEIIYLCIVIICWILIVFMLYKFINWLIRIISESRWHKR